MIRSYTNSKGFLSGMEKSKTIQIYVKQIHSKYPEKNLMLEISHAFVLMVILHGTYKLQATLDIGKIRFNDTKIVI